MAVEAPTGLDVLQDGTDDRKVGPLTAKEELGQVAGGPQSIMVVAADVSRPGTPNQILAE